jgi:hypothetical protein
MFPEASEISASTEPSNPLVPSTSHELPLQRATAATSAVRALETYRLLLASRVIAFTGVQLEHTELHDVPFHFAR